METKNERIAIAIYLLIGILGLPVYLYQWHTQSAQGWVCYARHGNIQETPETCKTKVGAGLVITSFSLLAAVLTIKKRARKR